MSYMLRNSLLKQIALTQISFSFKILENKLKFEFQKSNIIRRLYFFKETYPHQGVSAGQLLCHDDYDQKDAPVGYPPQTLVGAF